VQKKIDEGSFVYYLFFVYSLFPSSSASGGFMAIASPQLCADTNLADTLVIAAERRRGRGALSNAAGRFEPLQRAIVDDGWSTAETLPEFKTDVMTERPKSLITRNDSPDIGFDRSINPYRGCEHGCVYCFARPTHAYMGLSPGLDFETKLFVKEGAAAVLERELARPGYQPKLIAIGTNTDPYQPIERQHRLMRSILDVLARANHPVGIVTKSALVQRDIDILQPMAAKNLVKVAISITTLDPILARKLEPRAPTPARRLETIRVLAAAGIPVSVMVAPIIPAINDSEIETILTRAHAYGAQSAGYVLLRLTGEVKELFRQWLLEHYPDKMRHVISLVQSTHDGQDYNSAFGRRMTGTGPYAWMLGRRFELASQKLGLEKSRIKLRMDLFSPPQPAGTQLNLF
jgi:DNA repair photolyase